MRYEQSWKNGVESIFEGLQCPGKQYPYQCTFRLSEYTLPFFSSPEPKAPGELFV